MAYQRSGSNPSSDKGLLHNINVVLIQHRWRTGAMPPPPRLCGKMTTGVNLAKRLADGKSTKAESHAGLLSSHFFFFIFSELGCSSNTQIRNVHKTPGYLSGSEWIQIEIGM